MSATESDFERVRLLREAFWRVVFKSGPSFGGKWETKYIAGVDLRKALTDEQMALLQEPE